MVISSVQLGNTVVKSKVVSAIRIPATKKQVLGKQLKMFLLPDDTLQDWKIEIEADLLGGNRDTDRDNIRNLDDLTPFDYVDGTHNGRYLILPGSLNFPELGQRPTFYRFTVTIIQYQQVD